MSLALFETAAGYALFKVLDKDALTKESDIHKKFATPEKAAQTVKLLAFSKFEDTAQALAAASAICDGKLDKSLKKFLQSSLVEKEMKGKLAVAEAKLGGLIKEKLPSLVCVHDNAVEELMRGIRSQIDSLLSGISAADSRAMKLGLSHSLGRYKLKMSPDKVDTMIIQAISLLDELDKELNTYAMRVREWYGWHFPEMGKIVVENIMYAKTVKTMGVRKNAPTVDLSNVMPEDLEKEVKAAAEVSMGTEISVEDITNIQHLADQVISISEYRTSLFDYLKNRMQAIAPNLTVMVGELVGARLIAHAGSLLSLAKHPASTVQILGAEKALFRALKTKHDTPKYGLIYHASLVGQAAPKNKGKVSRVLANKSALACRVDALGEAEGPTEGIHYREVVENRVRVLEGGKALALSGTGKGKAAEAKYTKPTTPAKTYNSDADVALGKETKEEAKEDGDKEKKKKDKKDKKRRAEEAGVEAGEEAAAVETTAKKAKVDEEADGDKKKKKKKDKKKEASE